MSEFERALMDLESLVFAHFLLNPAGKVEWERLKEKLVDAHNEETRGFRAMISCEEVPRECGRTDPDPADHQLSRCLMHQLEVARFGKSLT